MDRWEDRNICVTGVSGFLGSFVLQELVDSGCKIFNVYHKMYELTQVDDIRRMMNDAKPDVIIHLAAQAGGIGANRLHPAEFYYNNLMMGTQLMHEAWVAGVEKFVTIGTVCAYPKYTTVPFMEDDLWRGYPEETNAPYGLAKKMMLVQGQAYRQQYGFNSIHLLPANLYGERDNFHPEHSHVIPALIRKMTSGEDTITVWGDGTPTREFLYAGDAAKGIVLAAQHYNEPQPVNLGTGREISIDNLVSLIAELTGFDGTIFFDRTKPNGQPRRCLDVRRARDSFGFEAETTLREGLQRTIDWYRKNDASKKKV